MVRDGVNDRAVLPSSRDVTQHSSHQNLLAVIGRDETGIGSPDAIIVPTVRPAGALREAIRVAQINDCFLLALCSRNSDAEEALRQASGSGVKIVVVDVDDVRRDVLPRFECDRLISDTEFRRKSDLSFKRNLGMYFARLAGWRRVFFLDDDIVVPDGKDPGRAVGLLERYRAVGLKVGGYPDNSVVCHANREVGGFQDTYIGGGALAVDVDEVESFFPDIYNEDWFFLSDVKSAVVGDVVQERYDPFRSPHRAKAEEFGDSLAEGLYALRDLDRPIEQTDVDYWETFLGERRRLIKEIMNRARTSPDNRRIVAALRAARTRCWSIRADFCVRYLDAWRSDRLVWADFLSGAAKEDGPANAVRALGIEDAVRIGAAPPRLTRVTRKARAVAVKALVNRRAEPGPMFRRRRLLGNPVA
jgi:hypothetical protein